VKKSKKSGKTRRKLKKSEKGARLWWLFGGDSPGGGHDFWMATLSRLPGPVNVRGGRILEIA
jgi:hypothetical protein